MSSSNYNRALLVAVIDIGIFAPTFVYYYYWLLPSLAFEPLVLIYALLVSLFVSTGSLTGIIVRLIAHVAYPTRLRSMAVMYTATSIAFTFYAMPALMLRYPVAITINLVVVPVCIAMAGNYLVMSLGTLRATLLSAGCWLITLLIWYVYHYGATA